MTIEKSLFALLVVFIFALVVAALFLWRANAARVGDIASMSANISEMGRENASLRAEHTRLASENALLRDGKALAERMATSLGEGMRFERAAHEAMAKSGIALFTILGQSMSESQLTPGNLTAVLADLEVSDRRFIDALMAGYYGWPGEPVEPADYTHEQAATATLIRAALGVLA